MIETLRYRVEISNSRGDNDDFPMGSIVKYIISNNTIKRISKISCQPIPCIMEITNDQTILKAR